MKRVKLHKWVAKYPTKEEGEFEVEENSLDLIKALSSNTLSKIAVELKNVTSLQRFMKKIELDYRDEMYFEDIEYEFLTSLLDNNPNQHWLENPNISLAINYLRNPIEVK